MDNEVVALGYGLIFDSLSVVIITVISFINLIMLVATLIQLFTFNPRQYSHRFIILIGDSFLYG